MVVDEDVNVRAWPEVVWAMTTRMDPARDTLLIEHTPIDYLDFAPPTSGLGSKMGLDATNKWPGETQREWGRTMAMDADVAARMKTLGMRWGCEAADTCTSKGDSSGWLLSRRWVSRYRSGPD